ncbi:MAG: hypothetical protein ACPGVG_10825 [Mycobacterium sp.]
METKQHRIAIRHLDAIEELLDQMDDAQIRTDVYRRHLPKWTTLTLRHPHDWQNQNATKHVDSTALDHLLNLSDWFLGFVPSVATDGLDSLRDFVESTQAVLEEDDSLDPALKRHVQRVIDHLTWCIDEYERIGDFELREAVDRLIAAMVTTAARSKHQGRWRDAMNTFVYPFTVNVAAAIPAQAVIQLALGGG